MRRPRRRSTNLTILCAAALAAAIVVLPAANATAATLQLAGPAGAVVQVNGAIVGFLPLSEPLTVPPGVHELVCDMPGRIPHRQTIVIERDDEWRHVTVRVLPYSRKTAVFSNLALAGLGPRYLGHGTRGWIYTVAEAGGLVTALLGEVSRHNADKEYLLAQDAYRNAVNQGEIADLRASVEARHKDVADAADLRDLGLMTAAGAVVISMLDSWLSFGAVTGGAGELPVAGDNAAVDAAGSGAAVSQAAFASPSFHSAVRLSF
jgi:hypothetical protein